MSEWTKGNLPHGFWKDRANHRRYADWLGNVLGYKTMDDWYAVRKSHIRANSGGGLLGSYYDNSPSRFVRENYPDYPWKLWLFGGVLDGFWDDSANRRAFFTDLGVILDYKRPEDWYQLTCRLIHEHGGGGLLVGRFEGSPQLAVIEHIPDFNWQPEGFTAGKKTQKALFSIVQRYMWSFEHKWDYKYKAMRYYKSDYPMELDIFIPHLRIGIEYQGEQHFVAVDCWGGAAALKEIQARDEEKRKMCKVHHIDLIEIDYTWKGEKSVVIDAVRQVLIEREAKRPEYRMVKAKKYTLFLPIKKDRRENTAE